MDLILNNPYRTVGLLAGATAREQNRQIKRLKQYIAAEQKPEDGYSFPVLGPLSRTLADVENAEARLNLNADKMEAAMFWFWNGNPVTDEAAFEALKDGDVQRAVGIWGKLVYDEEEQMDITEKNFSAYHNLTILDIVQAKDDYFLAINQGLCFLDSDLVRKFVASVTDETYKISKKELQLLFLKQLYFYSGIEANKKKLSGFIKDLRLTFDEYAAVQDFLNGLAKKYIGEIERLVDDCRSKRKVSGLDAQGSANDLYKHAAELLVRTKSVLGVSDVRYTSIADKVANEILQCAIDHYNDSQDLERTLGLGLESLFITVAMDVAKKAKTIAVGSIVKERIENTINRLEEAKNRELSEAVEVLKHIKSSYYEYYRLDWDKVVEIIQEAIPRKNIESIKSTSNASALREFKALVEFLFDKMPSYESNKIDYVYYWKPVAVKKNTVAPQTTTSVSRKTASTQTKTISKTTISDPVDEKNEESSDDWTGWLWLIVTAIVLFYNIYNASLIDAMHKITSISDAIWFVFGLLILLFGSVFLGTIISGIFAWIGKLLR